VVDVPKLANELSNLTVLEAKELAKILKEKWRVDREVQDGQRTASGGGQNEGADISLVQDFVFRPREINLRRLSKEEKKERIQISSSLKSPSYADIGLAQMAS
jgi:Ribosomal protein L7/L12 dimerisation domain